MKNIGIIISSLKGGGAERVVSIISKELSKRYNVYLIIFNGEDIVYRYGGNLIDLNIKPHRNYIVKAINIIKRTYKVKKIKKLYNINTTFSFLHGPNVVNILSKNKDKIIVSIRSNLSKGNVNKLDTLNKFLKKIIYNRSSEIIAISKGVSIDLEENYGMNKKIISYIHNPININSIKTFSTMPLGNELKIFSDSFIIINIGRLTHAKGQWHLIRSMIEIKKTIKNVKLLILGQGELEVYLKELVVNLKLENHVIFLGYKKNPFKYISFVNLS